MDDKVKYGIINFFKDRYKMIIFFIILFLVIQFPVPYYVFTTGGITDLSKRFVIEDSYTQKGSYNLSYVSQLDGNVLTYLLSNIIPSWEAVEVENYQYGNESLEELAIRDKLSLIYANQTAVMLAYGKAGKEIKINDKTAYVHATYDFLDSDVPIKTGDILIGVEGENYEDFQRVITLINEKDAGDTIEFEFQRNDETFKANLKVKEVSGVKAVGVKLMNIFDYDVTPKIRFLFKDSESGSSAGLMTTLAIYDSLIEEDLTHGLKIAGTGTIESNGYVGQIGGVEYKLAGAENDDADIFFAPSGENYKEAIRLKEKWNYDIDVVEVETLDDAINYLKNLKSN